MASILKVDGKWRAQVRRAGAKSKAKTFDSYEDAEKWAILLEGKIKQGERKCVEADKATVGYVIEQYRELRERGDRQIRDQSTEEYMLQHLQDDLGKLRVVGLTPDVMMEWARSRSGQGAGGATIEMELSKLGTVLRFTAGQLNLVLPDVVGAARIALHHNKMICAATKRTRRPTEDEIVRILMALPIEYARATAFAAMSTLRRAEVCRIEWRDLNRDDHTIFIRGRKHPRVKGGVDEFVPLNDFALGIINAQPQTDARIFPLNSYTLTQKFREACDACGISNLKFHDLRHEGTSLLFEEGEEIPVVSLYTGHKNWENLKRYTNLSASDVRFSAEQRKARAQKKRLAVSRAVLGPQLRVVGE